MAFDLDMKKDMDEKSNLINIHKEVSSNPNFRKEVWTGGSMQVTVMTIPVGGEVGLEMHNDLEQFIKVESGCANVYMGDTKRNVKFIGKVNADYAIVVPSGMWHNVINACSCPLKVYSVYAPPKHRVGTVHKTKLDSDLAED